MAVLPSETEDHANLLHWSIPAVKGVLEDSTRQQRYKACR